MKRYIIHAVTLAGVLCLLLASSQPAVFAQTATPNPGNMTTGLVSCWDLNEASGTRNDSYGSNHLTDNNTVGSAAGLIANAAAFVAANSESLSIVENAGLSVAGDIDFSVASWVYLTSKSTSQTFIGKWAAVGNREYIVEYVLGTDRFRFSVSDNGAGGFVEATTFGSPSTGVWYLIIASHNTAANTIGISVNGGALDVSSYSAGLFDSTADVRLGARSNADNYLGGRLDTTLFSKTAWTADQRGWLFAGGAGRSCADIANTAATPTPTSTATPTSTSTPTPTPTVTPTPTPSPGPKVYTVELPEGGEAHVIFDFTAGEMFSAVILLAVLATLVFRQVVDLAWLNAKR